MLIYGFSKIHRAFFVCVAVALERAPLAGRAFGSAPLQQFPARPLPLASPWTGLHSTRERAGKRVLGRRGEPGASSARGRGGRSGRGPKGLRGGPGGGNDLPAAFAGLGFPPACPGKDGKGSAPTSFPPLALPADLSLLLKGSWRAHTSAWVTSAVMPPPRPCHPPLVRHYLIPMSPFLPLECVLPGVDGSGINWPRRAGMRGGKQWDRHGHPVSLKGRPTVLSVFQGGVGEEPS